MARVRPIPDLGILPPGRAVSPHDQPAPAPLAPTARAAGPWSARQLKDSPMGSKEPPVARGRQIPYKKSDNRID
jgi:hypothetical protein